MAIYETNTTCSLCTRHCAHWCKIEVKAAGNINKITHGFIHSNKLALINNLLIRTYGKAMHGLRWKDLSHKDRQSFDSVEHIIKVAPLLSKMADAVGTDHYFFLMKMAVYSYLDKGISQEQHIHDIWYAVFFEVLANVDFKSTKIYIEG